MSNSPLVSPLLNNNKVIPVVVIENQSQAIGLANALVDGGVNSIEITLRNEFGLTAIELIKREVQDIVVMAGTVNCISDMKQAIDAGSDALVSPGLDADMVALAANSGIPYLPGVATGSEVMRAANLGLRECKLFPATVVGGVPALKALAGPFAGMKFCPTGGIGEGNYRDFLALDNVICVGGSWIAPNELIVKEDWSAISARCRALSA